MNPTDLNQSKAKRIYGLIESNPNLTFNLRKICRMYDDRHKEPINPYVASAILSRLLQKGVISRTKTQLSDGYSYSLSNTKELDQLYDKYLLPYDFADRGEIIRLITKSKFGKLKSNTRIGDYLPKQSAFIDKYGLGYFLDQNISDFTAMNLGFLMCDGNLRKDLKYITYYFFKKEDGELFKKDFLEVFPEERLSLTNQSHCFRVGISSKSLFTLFNSLGVPIGNKVQQEFLIPEWIYNGPASTKRILLSTIFGNEGSKPQDSRWRIQFVLSKSKRYVPNLLQFLNQVRAMLNYFNIPTSHIQLRKQEGRAFSGRFYIRGKENVTAFYRNIGFLYASEKQEVLESLVLNGKS